MDKKENTDLKKEKKTKKAKKVKKSKKKRKLEIKKVKVKTPKEDLKEQDTTPTCTPPHGGNFQNPSPAISSLCYAKCDESSPEKVEVDPDQANLKKVDLVDYEDDDDEYITGMEIHESFPLSKDIISNEQNLSNWEKEEVEKHFAPVEEDETFKDGFSTPIFVNPSPPADHKFNNLSSTKEIGDGSVTPPISSTMYKRQESEEPETKLFKPSKQLFGIDDIYSDVLNSISRSAAKKPITPSPSPSSSSSEEEVDEGTTTPPLELITSNIEPENPYANFSEEDLTKIQKLDENLAKIQSMRSNYGDPADEFCEGLNKMEKFLTTARNITIQKYTSTPQFLVTLQEAELKDDHSPSIFQSSIKMVITPSSASKNRVKSGTSNLLGSDEEEDVADKEEPKKVIEEKVVVKEEKKPVVEVKKDRKSTRSPEKKEKDRRPYKRKSESPNRRKRSRSPKVLDKVHRRDRHVVGKYQRFLTSIVYCL